MRDRTPSSDLAVENTPWGLVLLLVGVGIVVAFQVGKVPPMLPAIRSELGMSLFVTGWILSIFNAKAWKAAQWLVGSAAVKGLCLTLGLSKLKGKEADKVK